MNLLILRNFVSNQHLLDEGLAIAKQLASSIGLDLKYTLRDTLKKFSSVSFLNSNGIESHHVNPIEIFNEAKLFSIPFDAAVLVFDWDRVSPKPTNPTCVGMNIQIPDQWSGVPLQPIVFAEFLLHELCHHFYQGLGLKDLTHNWSGDLGFANPIEYYLSLLKTMIKPTITPTPINVSREPFRPKNFALKELVSPEVLKKNGDKAWQFLDERILKNIQWLRDKTGRAIIVNNLQNKYKGFDACEYRKEGTSQHNQGRALDFYVVGMTSIEVTELVVKHQNELPEPNMWVETGVSHNHWDVRYSDKKGIYLFKP